MVSTRRWDGFSPWRSGCIGKAAGPYNWRCFHGGRPCALHLGRGGIRYAHGDDGKHRRHPSHRWQRPYRLGGYHWLYGHRHRVRVGMTAGALGLALWSFLMATAHGAGLMLVPALVPLCSSMPIIGSGSLLISLAAVAVHTLATLA